MLCEKCRRRQAAWGTLCEECEKEQASVARQTDVVQGIYRMKTLALWMAGEFLLVGVLGTVSLNFRHASPVRMGLCIVVALAAIGMALYAWWLWRGYISRIEKGELSQVAYDLVHAPKGYWKWLSSNHDQEPPLIRPRVIGGTMTYVKALREFLRLRQALEKLAEDAE